MDMAFLQRAERMLARGEPVRIDHAIFIATLAAQRQATVTIHLQVHPTSSRDREPAEEPLVELLIGGPSWRQALRAQRGCFSRAEAGRRINGF
ncbi:MAG: hypothetical protein M3177_05865 [Pseudomonadota bacterium]|nr:hypothetical protein [Pseudomonadota bacterium]